MSDDARIRFAVGVQEGVYDEIDLKLLDPADEDQRRILIEADHPELHRALRDDLREIRLQGEIMSPALHIAMHEVVANQLCADDPPEVWETGQRLLAAGYERHEALHMLASVVSAELYEIMHDHKEHDPERTRRALAALPESWEQQRAGQSEFRHQNRAERRAAARRHRG